MKMSRGSVETSFFLEHDRDTESARNFAPNSVPAIARQYESRDTRQYESDHRGGFHSLLFITARWTPEQRISAAALRTSMWRSTLNTRITTTTRMEQNALGNLGQILWRGVDSPDRTHLKSWPPWWSVLPTDGIRLI
jgi:hypothetical protein